MDDVVTYRCNACGHNDRIPYYCDCCGTPICNVCKRPNRITNLTEMQRLVSDKVPDGKPTRQTGPSNKKKPAKKSGKSIESLMGRVADMEKNRRK